MAIDCIPLCLLNSDGNKVNKKNMIKFHTDCKICFVELQFAFYDSPNLPISHTANLIAIAHIFFVDCENKKKK